MMGLVYFAGPVLALWLLYLLGVKVEEWLDARNLDKRWRDF